MYTNFLKRQHIKIALTTTMIMTMTNAFGYKVTIKNGTDGILKRIYITGSHVAGTNDVVGDIDDIGQDSIKTVDTGLSHPLGNAESRGDRPLASLTIMYNRLSRGYKLPVDSVYNNIPIGNGHEERDITLTVKVNPEWTEYAKGQLKTERYWKPTKIQRFILEEGIQ